MYLKFVCKSLLSCLLLPQVWYIVEIYISWAFQIEKKNIFFEYANFMQMNPPNWGVVVFKIKEVPSPQRSLQI